MQITFTTDKGKANFPFLVEYKNTENWSTKSAHLTKDEAIVKAKELAERYPRLPVRVTHYQGGAIVDSCR